MNGFCLLPLCILFSTPSFSQFIGGNGDGYELSISVGQNNSPGIYMGDANDGLAIFSIPMQNFSPAIYSGSGDDGFNAGFVTDQNPLPQNFLGGIDDGTSAYVSFIQNPIPSFYTGGVDDGMNSTSSGIQNSVPSIYAGGENDGTDFRTSFVQNAIPDLYRGNSGDGFVSFTTRDNPSSLYYIFTGTGNWNIASNWLDNLIPPAYLPGPREIIINPSTGDCTLNIIQTLMPGSKLSVATGKVFVVPGNIY